MRNLAAARVLLPPRIDAGALRRRQQSLPVVSADGPTMGTRWSLRCASALGTEQLRALVEPVLDEVIAEMSGWEADSALGRFNRAPAGSWFMMPPGLFSVLDAALKHARDSDGAFDPAIGALVDLWGFGPLPCHGVPDDAAIVDARALGGWQRLEIDRAARRALQPGGLRLDLSGIAKGHAVDRVSRTLLQAGVTDHLVEIGGELAGAGLRSDGQPWWVELEAPPGGDLPPLRVALHGLAVATSGNYRRAFSEDGRSFSHSIDPRTGWPIAHDIAAVSVIADDCMTADALATLLTVLGPEDGPRHAAQHDVAARFIVQQKDGFREILSPAMMAMAA